MTPRQVRKYCPLKPEAPSMLKAAMEELGLSARAHDKVLRVARTMADLEGSDAIQPQHIAEAVGFRSLDRERLGLGRRIELPRFPGELPLQQVDVEQGLVHHPLAGPELRRNETPGSAP